MPTPHTLRLLIAAAAALAHSAAAAQHEAVRTKHWTGGSGDWNDAAHWSLSPGGPGGAGVPRTNEDVSIAPAQAIEVRITGAAWCRNLRVDGTHGAVRIAGGARSQLNIAGGWWLQGAVEWPQHGVVTLASRAAGVELDLRGTRISANMVFDGGGAWSSISDLRTAGLVTLRRGTLITNGNLLRAQALRAEGKAPKRLIAGGSAIVLDAMPVLAALHGVVEPGTSTLAVNGQTIAWGSDPAASPGNDRDVNVCATGPGQTPFVVTTSVVTNYNGFGVRCRGECNATVTVTVSGGIGPFAYQWLNGGPNTATWTTACGGPQIVIVTDLGQGVSCPVAINVSEPAPLGVIFFGSGTPPSCPDVCDGSRTALGVGGVPPISYNWNNGAGTGSSFSQLCAGNNTLVVTDANGCEFDTTFFFNLQPLQPNLVVTPAACFGTCNGSATVNPQGGTGSFTVLWSPNPPVGQGTNTASGLCAGPWSVTITDANGCDSTQNFIITQPPPISIAASQTDASCFGTCDGTASVVPSGAAGPFTYAWSPAPGSGQGTGSVGGLCEGPYTVTITDQASGCDTTITLTIDAPGAIDVQGVPTNASCSDACDGSVVISLSGGQPPYTIVWAPVPPVGQGSTSVSGLCPGPWSVTVSDAASCDTTLTFQITAPPPLAVTAQQTNVTCAGACNGTAGVQVSGGTPGYTYSWTPAPPAGQGTPNASGLCAGPWSVTITDLNGCDTTVTFTITAPPPLQAIPTQTNVTCNGLCNGTASVAVSGGTPGYTYTWTPAPPAGQGTPNASGLCAGPWSVTITDLNGCTLTVPFTILDPVPLTLLLQSSPATCPGVCDGTAGVVVSGGTGPYSYTWSPTPGTGQGTPGVTGLCAGPYTLTVTDAVGCDTTVQFIITEPPAIQPNAIVQNATCAGTCNGSIVLTPTGGTGAYSFVWNPIPPNGQGGNTATGLCPGPYQVTIASGACDTTLTFQITAPPPIVASVTTGAQSCAGDCAGTAQATVSGGTPGYTYTWSPAPPVGQGTPLVSGLCPGPWSVTIADLNGCDTTIAFVLTDPPPIQIALSLTESGCDSLCAGTATANVSGGVPPYQYQWGPGTINGQGTPNATGLCSGIFTLSVTDAAGCDTTVQFIIAAPSGIVATPVVSDVQCAGSCTGAVNVPTIGGVPPYTWTWSPAPPIGQGTANVQGLCTGTYTLVISDLLNCDTTLLVTIGAPPPLALDTTHTDESCNGPCDGQATAIASGGTGPYTYVWSPTPPAGQGTPTASQLCPGTWTVIVTDANGCDSTVVFDVLPKQVIVVDPTIVNTSCTYTCDGAISTTISGGIPPYTFDWSPDPPVGEGTPSAEQLCPGPWSLTVTDSQGCDTTRTFLVDTPPALVASVSTTSPNCFDNCSASATVTASGGSGTLFYDWSPQPGGGQGSPTATGLCAGVPYTVTVTDGNGCDTTITFVIDPFQPITGNSSSTPATCSTSCNGTATVGPTGGAPPYTYAWSPAPGGGQGTPQATGLCPGVVQVTITDANGCSTVESILITAPDPLAANAVQQNISCAGACDGSITLNTTGGTAPYTYVWSPVPPNGQGGSSATGLCPGGWQVTVTDANQCTATFSFTITEPAPLQLSAQVTPSQCLLCVGAAQLLLAGGTPFYLVQWFDPSGALIAIGDNISGACAGIYTVVVTDGNGCTASLPVPIPDADGEVLTPQDGITNCPNTCDGTVGVSFNCSQPPCTIAWTDASGNALGGSGTVSGLCPGSYFATVTNAQGCISIATAVVIAPTPPTYPFTSSPVSCNGACDGSAAVGVIGGTPPFTFTWSPAPGGGQGTPIATGLCGGVYQVLITEGNGCDTTLSVLITEPGPLLQQAVVQPISCAGQCDGSITLSPGGGTVPYTVLWNPVPPNGQGVTSATNLCAGDYTVALVDGNGCSVSDTYTIVEPAPLSVTGSSTPSTCPLCNGTASVSIAGGTGPYTVTWTVNGAPAGTGPVLSDLCAGIHIATVSDAAGCTATATVPVADSNAEQLTMVNGQVTCSNDCDGTVEVQFTCSAPPCSVLWADAQGNPLVQGTTVLDSLCIGDYLVQVTNANGCVSIGTATVSPSQLLNVFFSSTPVSCAGACDGSATVAAGGGVPPYTYTWSPEPGAGQGTPQATGLCAGPWSVTIADASGCDTTVTVLILEPAPLDVLAVVQDVTCNGACDGAILTFPSGGVAPYTFAWSPAPPTGQGTNNIAGLCATTWSLVLTDANGCSLAQAWTIAEPDPLTLTAGTVQSECGLCNGAAGVVVSGGTPGYNVLWTLGGAFVGTTDTIAALCAGLYFAEVTDANGCQAAQFVPVSDSNGEQTSTANGITTCPGDCDGTVSVSFTCSDPPCTIAWYDGAGNDLGQSGNDASGLCAGAYVVVVTNATGCITIDTALVASPDPIVANLSTTPVSCPGGCNGTATVGPTGGAGGYTYLWQPGGQTTPSVTGLCAGPYTVTITDAEGCSIDQGVFILEPSPLGVQAVVADPLCTGACDGSIVLTPFGGTAPYTYAWNPLPPNGQGTNAASSLCAGPWSVTLTDANGCTYSESWQLSDPPALTVDVAVTGNLCFGDCQGTATATISGGTGAYAIVWTAPGGSIIGQGVTAVSGLCAGDHVLSVTDANGCTVQQPFTVGQGAPIDANLLFTNETCFGPCDGTAAVAPTGGAGAPFTYVWDPAPGSGQGTPQVGGLCVGPWNVTIADAVGCDTTATFTILPFQPIAPNATVTNASCFQACDGAISLAPTGGFGGYSYTWTPAPPGTPGAAITDLCAGPWSVTITDVIGCSTDAQFLVTEPTQLTVQADDVVPATCSNSNDGSIAITASGGTPGYTYSWSGPGGFTSSAADIGGLFAGNYSLQVTDANGCVAALQEEVDALFTVQADAGADLEACAGALFTLDGSGSVGAVTFAWTDAQGNLISTDTTVTIGPLPTGSYTYTLTITNGPCTSTDEVTVTVLALPIANAGPDQTIQLNGSVTIGGSPAGPQGSVFSWSPDSTLSDGTVPNPVAQPTQTTWYVLTVVAPDGCQNTDSVLVTVVPEVVIPTGFTPNGDGWNDVWTIDFIDLFPQCEVEIYNRWGELLFRSVGYEQPWDGRYNGGPVPIGTYYYVILLNDPFYPDPYTGPLTVIR